jgi:hypothetical protein
MCPTSLKYINSEYIEHVAQLPVKVEGKFEKKLIQDASQILALTRQGNQIIFPDVLNIEKKLLNKQS